MRIIVFFDLPITTKQGKRNYTLFRRFLLQDGYDMLQFSVYGRLCNGMDNAQKHIERLNDHLPPKGAVRSLLITDKQYGNMKLWVGKPTQREKIVKQEQLILL